jgi:hypothetical protein
VKGKEKGERGKEKGERPLFFRKIISQAITDSIPEKGCYP